jgi:hypothetical protein
MSVPSHRFRSIGTPKSADAPVPFLILTHPSGKAIHSSRALLFLRTIFFPVRNDRPVQTFAKQDPTWLVQFPDLVKAGQRETLEKEIVGTTRERMVREICEALETITAQNPLVLCLEDLHWVDPSTLDFISALARRRGPAKLLLLGTYRPAEVIISQSPLKALKQDLVIHNLSHEIALERLEESDIAEYLGIEFVDAAFPDEPENPLRAIFLAAVSVRQILSENGVDKSARQRESRRGAAS